jgi:deaminated glutathione amidase
VRGLQEAAKDHKLAINVGVHEPTNPPSRRIRNTLLWINTDGEIEHRYQKVHLFDIDLRPDGPEMKESNSTEPGDVVENPYECEGLKFGSMICFDLRFPEISLRLRRLGAQVLLYPSAFTVQTGKMHWVALLRGRAIESQCWVLASAQCGRHNGRRVSWGESIAIDPKGEVVGVLDRVDDLEGEREGQRQPGMLLVDLEEDVVRETRKMIPLADLRRTDVYPQV